MQICDYRKIAISFRHISDFITAAFEEFAKDWYPKPSLCLVQDLWHAIQRIESTMVRSSRLFSRAKSELRTVFARFKITPPEQGLILLDLNTTIYVHLSATLETNQRNESYPFSHLISFIFFYFHLKQVHLNNCNKFLFFPWTIGRNENKVV